MCMPDELDHFGYRGRPYDELVALLLQRDDEHATLLELWRAEHRKRRELEAILGNAGHDPGA